MLKQVARRRLEFSDDAASTPHEIVVRSLRRRLFQAFQQGDAEKALWLYKATRADWERFAELAHMRQKQRRSSRKLMDDELSDLTMRPTEDSQDTFGVLQLEMSPSEIFRPDDLLSPQSPYNDLAEELKTETTKPRIRLRKTPFSVFRHGNKEKSEEAPGGRNSSQATNYSTTPLHEASRLGCNELIGIMMDHETADCEQRDGHQRTLLHMVAGGVIDMADPQLGIPPLQTQKDFAKKISPTKTSLVGKLFRRETKIGLSESLPPVSPCSMDQRMEAMKAILAWNSNLESSSINSVDHLGRTALHYAAELGRRAICEELLSMFGTNLTIVDDTGKTPCELADKEGHIELASFLEAKSVLYVDPYGIDDELFLSSSAIQQANGFSRKALTPPFSWFETLEDAQIERESRTDIMVERMRNVLQMKSAKEETRSRLLWMAKRQGEIIGYTATENQTLDPPEQISSEHEMDHDCSDKFNILADRLQHCHANAILAMHKWDIKEALIFFYQHPMEALDQVGLSLNVPEMSQPDFDHTCLICCDEFSSDSDRWQHLTNCDHKFCKNCLSDYISECSKSRQYGLNITCPHHACRALMSHLEIAELAPSSDDYGLLLATSNDDFVVKAHDLRFCPRPGCGAVVSFRPPDYKDAAACHSEILQTVGAVCCAPGYHGDDNPLTYEGVGDPAYYGCQFQPKVAHRFCFGCGEMMHWPVPCDMLTEWQGIVKEHVIEASGGVDVGEDYKEVAQKLWMKANTRPCPQCQVPIQKNDGCNHMTCHSCRHEFCWICSENWKLHSTETGGFFRCNRWIDQKDHDAYSDLKPDENDVEAAKNVTDEELANPNAMQATYGTAMHEARISRGRGREMGRFLHHYTRWNAHFDSSRLERNMRDTACERLAPVIEMAGKFSDTTFGDFNFGGSGLSFLHAAFTELLECRSTLQHSYACSYVRYKSDISGQNKLSSRLRSEKRAVEKIQADLEMMTEQLSDVVARSHLRATQTQILFLTTVTAEKRKEFSNIMVTALVQEQREVRKSKQAKGNIIPQANQDAVQMGQRNFLVLGENSTDLDHHETQRASGANSPASSAENATESLEAAIRASLADFLTNSGSLGMNDIATDDVEEEGDAVEWSCFACTYLNSTTTICAMCGTRRSQE